MRSFPLLLGTALFGASSLFLAAPQAGVGRRDHPVRCTLRCSRRLIVSDATSTSR